jgi:hypothetical protein
MHVFREHMVCVVIIQGLRVCAACDSREPIWPMSSRIRHEGVLQSNGFDSNGRPDDDPAEYLAGTANALGRARSCAGALPLSRP